MDKPKAKYSCIYFVRSISEPEFVKIGFSTNPYARIRTFVDADLGSVIMVTTEHPAILERIMHEALFDLRFKWEWFRMGVNAVSIAALAARHMSNVLSMSTGHKSEIIAVPPSVFGSRYKRSRITNRQTETGGKMLTKKRKRSHARSAA